ncbi:MAG: sigma-70 family RNA polymerase sigma factor [Myxococcales bacterium]|nr:sigma-70 family RNA polymerase sigma factor [Myxococcales bacterium]
MRTDARGGDESCLADNPNPPGALRAGDPAAFEALVRRHGGRLLAVARRILADEADAADAVQDAFLQAFRNLDRFEGNAQVGTWLHRIAVNAALMKLRSRKRRREDSVEALPPRFDEVGHREDSGGVWPDSTEASLDRVDLRRQVRAAIAQLPDAYRTVLLLRDIEEYDTAETAAALGVTEGVVKTRLHRARQALKSLLDPMMARP